MTRISFCTTAALAALVLTSQSPALAQPGRWERLGEANVDGRADHDSIRVGRADGRFTAIRFKAERGPIEFDRVVVHYGNGERQELRVPHKLRAGDETRVIDLPGNKRVIDRVEVWYEKARPNSEKPRLILFGRH